MTTSESGPCRAASTASRCPGRKAVRPKRRSSLSGESSVIARKLLTASEGSLRGRGRGSLVETGRGGESARRVRGRSRARKAALARAIILLKAGRGGVPARSARAPCPDDARAGDRYECDRAPAVALAPAADAAAGHAGVQLAEHRAQHEAHLEHREGGADAAADAAAEGDPGEGVGGRVEEALGAEGARVLIHARVAVGGGGGADDAGAGGELVRADGERLGQETHDAGDDRAGAQGLVDDGLHVVVLLARVDLGEQPFERVGGADEALDRPGGGGGGRLVAGEQQRDELVAPLAVGHRGAVLVAGLQE